MFLCVFVVFGECLCVYYIMYVTVISIGVCDVAELYSSGIPYYFVGSS